MDGSFRELSNPKLGRDFLAGTLEDGKSFGVFRRSILRTVEFSHHNELSSNLLQITRRAIGEVIAGAQFPALARIRYLEPGPTEQQVVLIGVIRGFVVTDLLGNQAIPIAALQSIEIAL